MEESIYMTNMQYRRNTIQKFLQQRCDLLELGVAINSIPDDVSIGVTMTPDIKVLFTCEEKESFLTLHEDERICLLNGTYEDYNSILPVSVEQWGELPHCDLDRLYIVMIETDNKVSPDPYVGVFIPEDFPEERKASIKKVFDMVEIFDAMK
jgi:hypothetical protein